MDSGDPALVFDEDQIAEWRSRAGFTNGRKPE